MHRCVLELKCAISTAAAVLRSALCSRFFYIFVKLFEVVEKIKAKSGNNKAEMICTNAPKYAMQMNINSRKRSIKVSFTERAVNVCPRVTEYIVN